MSKKNTKFSENDRNEIKTFVRYLKGEMTPEEKREYDGFCGDDCDLHTAFCDHKDKQGNKHNIHCFTHKLCWFDQTLDKMHKETLKYIEDGGPEGELPWGGSGNRED